MPYQDLEAQLEYWRTQLDGLQPVDLPLDHLRPAARSGAGASTRFTIAPDTTRALARLATTEGATLFMAALAAFHLLLSRWSGQDDITVGTPIAGRIHPDTEDLIGLDTTTAKFDLSLTLTEHPDGTLNGQIDYATDLYTQPTAHRLARRYQHIINHITTHPTQPVSEISMANLPS